MDQVTQGDTRLHFALEAHQHRLGHIQWHDTGCCGEGHQARPGGEGNPHGEAGVGVAAGADGVWQQHAVEPAVDDPVPGTQGHAAPGHDEVGECVLGIDVHRLGIGRSVAERLHGQVCRESQAGEVLQFVPGHGTGGVLGADGGHPGLAIGAGAYAGHAAGATDHFLGEGIAGAGVLGLLGCPEQFALTQPQGFPRPGGQATTDNQVDATTGPNLVQQHLGFQCKL